MMAISFVGKVARILVALVMLAMMAVQILPTMLGMTAMSSPAGSVPSWMIDAYAAALAFIVSVMGGFSSGFPAHILAPAAQYEQAQVLATRTTGNSTETIRRMRIIGVSFADQKAPGKRGAVGQIRGDVAVHLGVRPERAVVFVTNDALRWTFTGGTTERARLAFHGQPPAAITAPAGGALAELRLYGSSREAISGPLGAANAPADIKTSFCHMVSNWKLHYDLALSDIDYVELNAPRTIAVSEINATGDGQYGTFISGEQLGRMCSLSPYSRSKG